MFDSICKEVGNIDFPEYSGLRIMMMPIDFSDIQSCIPDFMSQYKGVVEYLVQKSGIEQGIGYITIDEAHMKEKETHRRPGIHVDGVGPDGGAAGWASPNPGGWGAGGMIVAASKMGCQAWNKKFNGYPEDGGCCKHLEDQCTDDDAINMEANKAYYLNHLAVHKPLEVLGKRQFLRLSFPNDAPWYEGYTENPTGVEPAGPIHSPRTQKMDYR